MKNGFQAIEGTLSRREFLETVGAGILFTISLPALSAERAPVRGGGQVRGVSARIHIGVDGTITVMTGKVEGGQGARAELLQAAAEELKVAPEKIKMVMGDTALVPDDGITAGSRTTPSTLPAVRQGAATARELLIKLAAEIFQTEASFLTAKDGVITHSQSGRSITYGELARNERWQELSAQPVNQNVSLTPVKEWKVMGHGMPRPNKRDIVTGQHKYPSDIRLKGMLYGKVLRPPAWGAKLVDVDISGVKKTNDVIICRDGQFVGVAAPTTFQAQKVLEEIEKTAKWETSPQPSNRDIFEYLRKQARGETANPFGDVFNGSAKKLSQTYTVAYVQHAPMETRSAVAQWEGDVVTIWMATQNPFGCRSEIARALNLNTNQVRVIVPDFGGGFGGKHTADAGLEAARLAKASGRPVLVKWSREEEFTWAYFRPAAVIQIEAGLDENGKITCWHYININSGAAAIDTPYAIARNRSRYIPSASPLRQGSYRALAATANNFARECFMDELAALAGKDPLNFRLAHIENQRLRAVLEEAAKRFNWGEISQRKSPGVGYGLACGTEKGSYVAACVEVFVDQGANQIKVKRVCEVFECGKVINPPNLLAQIQGCIIMGLGPALREEIRFANGKIANPKFSLYQVPRFSDVPELEIYTLDRADLVPVGAGETPIIAIAPAIANALFNATGKRIRQMPIKLT
jgi:isoquinoline 1-oxidoreductase